MSEPRTASENRDTAETKISIDINIDGSGDSSIDTGIPFFDHMLTLFARHSLYDLTVVAKGDIEVDYHHTVEDVGIVLGNCLRKALGDKRGISRYGWSILPMDETLSRVAIDFGGRPFYHLKLQKKLKLSVAFPQGTELKILDPLLSYIYI